MKFIEAVAGLLVAAEERAATPEAPEAEDPPEQP
jgi:hypothetical protein